MTRIDSIVVLEVNENLREDDTQAMGEDDMLNFRSVWGLVLVGAVMWAVVPSAQADAPQRMQQLKPADVVYTFNKIKPGGVVRDVSPPTNQRMMLKGNWARAADANGVKKALALRAKSLGEITRSNSLMPGRRPFAVSMVVKIRKFIGDDSPNLAQLGFFHQKRQWKVEVSPKSGHIIFRVKGSKSAATVASRVSIDDREYHHVTCFRKKGKFGVIIDGVKRSRSVATGSVRSPENVRIGNKHLKKADDQVRGNFDYFSIAIGRKAIARSIAGAPAVP